MQTRYKLIASYSFPLEAQIAKSCLDAANIPAYIADEYTINMDWLYSTALGGVKLFVAEEFAEDASGLLNQDFSDCLEDDDQD